MGNKNDDIKHIIKEYIRWRGNGENICEERELNIFKKLKKMDSFVKKNIKESNNDEYDIIKSMKLSLDDGPRMDKLPEYLLDGLNAEEILGLCGIISEKVVSATYEVDWDRVYESLFNILDEKDLNYIKSKIM
ncbi:putative secreted virulence factor [Lumpy skin disease virus]|uniref:LS142 n=1 Tax=Lumpy skin disease virus TaxID=59509 RepID=A0A1C9HHJ2_LSDV|nr:putative secreted virulence factor [Lumpy skin disease virus]AOO78703.1 putative secreted virulence factor [Lumpy skin disease virus]AOO78861.1 putative secreted virulence factor [Lumpy skin disease virus]AOO79020.1 putative secreted virulence factor [Lumpy skin disease virus]AVR51580.1 putative secreted virulence factor [Lumpy skin disease virus]